MCHVSCHLGSVVAGPGVHVSISDVTHREVIPATGGRDQPPGVPGHHIPGHLASSRHTHNINKSDVTSTVSNCPQASLKTTQRMMLG